MDAFQISQIKMSSIYMYSEHPKFSLNFIRFYIVKCYGRVISLFFSNILLGKPGNACCHLIFKDGVSQAPLKLENHNH